MMIIKTLSSFLMLFMPMLFNIQHMKALIIILLLLPVSLFGQELIKPGNSAAYYKLSIEQAKHVDFWARKGLSCDSFAMATNVEIALLQNKARLQETVNANLLSAQEQYRDMVKRTSKENQELNVRLSRVTQDMEEFKGKARRRGNTIAVIVGAGIIAGVVAFSN